MRAPYRSALLLAAAAVVVLALLRPLDAQSAWPKAYCRTAHQGGGGKVPPRCEDVLAGKIPDLRKARSVTFAVMGDMGRGTADQRRVGQAMATACATAGCRFAIAVGDNLYDGPTSLDDPRFRSWFVEPYAGLDLPVWLSLGNHDWYGDPAVEIAYTDRARRQAKGPYWFMPGPNYAVPLLPAWLDLLAIDTNSIHSELLQGVEAQRAWLNHAVPSGAAAKGRWTLLFGHHPYRSSGAHGDDVIVERFLAPWLQTGAIDAGFFGHDHHQEHYAAQETELFIQGAGSEVRTLRFDMEGRRCADASRRDCSRWKALDLGFSVVTVTPERLEVVFYAVTDAGARPAYTFAKPRS